MNESQPGLGANISNAIRGSHERSALDDALRFAQETENPDDIQQILNQFVPRLSPERQQQAAQAFGAIQNQRMAQAQKQKQRSFYESEGLNPDLAEQDVGIQKEFIKGHQAKNKKSTQDSKIVQDAFDRSEEILKSGYTGFSPVGLTPEGREQRAELDTLGEVFISHLIPLLNPRGTISQSRFNYIKSLVPNSWDTDATIKGKLAALKDIFRLEAPQGGAEKKAEKTREMRNSQGEIYDIPEGLYEQAKSMGLK